MVLSTVPILVGRRWRREGGRFFGVCTVDTRLREGYLFSPMRSHFLAAMSTAVLLSFPGSVAHAQDSDRTAAPEKLSRLQIKFSHTRINASVHP